MATWRGMDGSATYATIALANLRNIRWSARRGIIPVTVKGDLHAKKQGGLVDRSVSFDAILDYVTGQKNVIDFLEAATPDVTIGTLVITASSGKTWTYTSGALFAGYEIISPEGDNPVTVSLDFELTVPAVIAWV
jgi:hypothetical protein